MLVLFALAPLGVAGEAPEPAVTEPTFKVRPAPAYQLDRMKKRRVSGTAMTLVGPPLALAGLVLADDMIERDVLAGVAAGAVMGLTGIVATVVGPPVLLNSGFGARGLARGSWGRAPSAALGLASVGLFVSAVGYEIINEAVGPETVPSWPTTALYGAGALTAIIFSNRMIRLADGKPLRIVPGSFGPPTAGAPHAWGVVVSGRF